MGNVRRRRTDAAGSRSGVVLVSAMLLVACSGSDSAAPADIVGTDTVASIQADPIPEPSEPSATTVAPTNPPATTTTVPATETEPPVETSRPEPTTPPEPTTTTTTTTTTDVAAPADPTCPRDAELSAPPSEPVRVILDTDFSSDVDDVGALAVLHALADVGEVEILAVMVSDGGDAPSHRAIDAINTYYGRPDVPIGVVAGAAPATGSSYVSDLAERFANDIENPPAALDLYRDILEAAPDGSVTIVSVGYLTNLDALLSSQPDERSNRSGTELVSAKVAQWVSMGGAYPDSDVHPFGAEFNFVEDSTATLNAVADWPTPAIFSGWEIGAIVLTGAALQDLTPPENPVREAYRIFNGGLDHRSWDLTAVLVAVRGTAGLFEVCAGRNLIGPGATNSWELSADGPHGFLRLVVPAADAATEIDRLLVQPPALT